jgi:hypothetical protein
MPLGDSSFFCASTFQLLCIPFKATDTNRPGEPPDHLISSSVRWAEEDLQADLYVCKELHSRRITGAVPFRRPPPPQKPLATMNDSGSDDDVRVPSLCMCG